MKDIVCTGKMIQTYLAANGYTIQNLAESSKSSIRTIYRIFNDECKLSYEVAVGINTLIPEISVEFLMTYDTKYQLQKKQLELKNGIENLDKVVEHYKLKKLFPELSKDKKALIERAKEVFGIKNIQSGENEMPWLVSVNYSLANNADDFVKTLWLQTAYRECCEKEMLEFDRNGFLKEFDSIKQLSGTSNYEMTIFNIKMFCKKCGLNYHLRNSIPNSRIKAVTVKDNDGRIIILMSDLFKCVENLWIAFVHELEHIKKEDYNMLGLYSDEARDENENYVSEETARYFIGDLYDDIKTCDIETVFNICKQCNVPQGIVAEIVRFKTGDYKNRQVNSLLNFY